MLLMLNRLHFSWSYWLPKFLLLTYTCDGIKDSVLTASTKTVKDVCFLQYIFCDYFRKAQILKGIRRLSGDKWNKGKIDALCCPDRADRILWEKGKGRKMRIGLTGIYRTRVFLYASCARFFRWCNSLFRALLLYGSTCNVLRLCFQPLCRPWPVMAILIQTPLPQRDARLCQTCYSYCT